MARLRGSRMLLATAVLTTGLWGCDFGGLPVNDGNQLKNGGNQNTSGDQLLSNAAASAIGDLIGSFRDVGALKNMASQQPLLSNAGSSLLSNAGGSLLSNGMSGYRIAAAALSYDEFNAIVWEDSNASSWIPGVGWPGVDGYDKDGYAYGTVTGKLDGVVVEQYTYRVKQDGTTYEREETVVKSRFRPLGVYQLAGAIVKVAENAQVPELTDVVIQGTSTFDPEGVNRKLDYTLDAVMDYGNGVPYVVTTTVQGTQPSGMNVDLTLEYALGEDGGHELFGQGKLSQGGKTLEYESSAAITDSGKVEGYFALGLMKDFWLHFGFESDKPLVGTLRNDKGEKRSDLAYAADKKKVIISYPDEKQEHLDVDVLPRLYLQALDASLPPF